MGTVLDVAIGLTVVYLLFAVVCSAINEAIAWGYGLRASTLRNGIKTLLSLTPQSPRLEELLNHPILKGLRHVAADTRDARTQDGERGPSYVPSHMFVSALLDQLRQQAPKRDDGVSRTSLDELRRVLEHDAWAKAVLLPQIDDTVESAGAARARLERWFDDAMTRVSGEYKRKTQRNILVIAACVCAICNVDSLQIARSLYSDTPQRAALVAAADRLRQSPSEVRADPAIDAAVADLTRATTRVKSFDLPIGWHEGAYPTGDQSDALAWLGKALGILCSMIAVSLGAPFWFELVNKIANVRFAGAPPPRAEAREASATSAK